VLEEFDKIDIVVPIPPDGLMLVAMDSFPWPDPDSADRFTQLHRKLDGYCRYVTSRQFAADHPNVDKGNLHILVMCVAPPSEQMSKIRAVAVEPQGSPGFQIAVLYRSVEAGSDGVLESNDAGVETDSPPKPTRSWWRFWR
jgi:hypothetical protein